MLYTVEPPNKGTGILSFIGRLPPLGGWLASHTPQSQGWIYWGVWLTGGRIIWGHIILFVRYLEFRGCLYLGGLKCVSSMVESIRSTWFIHYNKAGRSSEGPLLEVPLYTVYPVNYSCLAASLCLNLALRSILNGHSVEGSFCWMEGELHVHVYKKEVY